MSNKLDDPIEEVCVNCGEDFNKVDELNICSECVKELEDGYFGWEYACPNCGWDTEEVQDDETAERAKAYASNVFYDIDGNRHWTEHYTCPHCQTEFEFNTGW